MTTSRVKLSFRTRISENPFTKRTVDLMYSLVEGRNALPCNFSVGREALEGSIGNHVAI